MKNSKKEKSDKKKDKQLESKNRKLKKSSDSTLDKRNPASSDEKLLSREEINKVISNVEIKCSCGFGFTSQLYNRKSDRIDVIVCYKCHPFFSGKKKVVDETQRISKFNKKYRTE